MGAIYQNGVCYTISGNAGLNAFSFDSHSAEYTETPFDDFYENNEEE